MELCAGCDTESSEGMRYYCQHKGELVWVCWSCLPRILSRGLAVMDYTRHEKAQAVGQRGLS